MSPVLPPLRHWSQCLTKVRVNPSLRGDLTTLGLLWLKLLPPVAKLTLNLRSRNSSGSQAISLP